MDIFQEIVSVENLFCAWREFRRGKRFRADVAEFERHLEDNIFVLHKDLASGVYRHGIYHRFHVYDPKHRIIHKATVRDRLVHHAICRVLMQLFDPTFVFDSYSCRTNKGTHAAVRRLETFTRRVSKNYSGPCWTLKFDIRKFFDSVDHEILLEILAKKLSPQDESVFLMSLLSKIVQSYSTPTNVRGGGHSLKCVEQGSPSVT